MSERRRPFAIADESRAHALGSDRLRLTFAHRDDRWSHGLELDGAPIVRAIEPSADESNRFAVPVFQQASLSIDDEADSVALLVGQEGRNHSSASFLVETTEGGSTIISVDLAIRATRLVATEPISPASTYLVEATSSDLIEAADSRIVWSLRNGGGRLTLEAVADDLSNTTLGLAEGGRRATLVQAIARFDPRSLTQRSRYRWIWEPARDHS